MDTLPPVQPGVERIENPDRVNQVRDDLIAGARRTVQITLPAGPYPRALLEAQWDVGVAVLGRDVRISGVYQADAAREPDALTLLTAFARRGADLRIASSISHRTVVVDRSCVIVATEEGMGRHPALLVTEPALVAGFCARFDALRAAAVPVGGDREDALSAAGVRQIIGLLRSGATDEMAARTLGVSERTVRRRIAAVMTLLGASGRFEAGVRAARSGWV